MARKRMPFKTNNLLKEGGNSLVRVGGGLAGNFAINMAEENVPFVQGKPGMAAGLVYAGTLLFKIFSGNKMRGGIIDNTVTGMEVIAGVDAVSELIDMATSSSSPTVSGQKPIYNKIYKKRY